MLRNNCTNLKIGYIFIVFVIINAICLIGIIVSKGSNLGIMSMSKNINVILEEKDFEANVDEKLVAYSDNVSLEIKVATPREKISSRASNIRRSRGETSDYVSVDQVSISPNMNLNVRTGLSREDFVNLMANVSADTSGFFEQNAGIIYDLCEIYSINEIFFCGLISAESGWNIASNHRNTHNYISLMSAGGLISYPSVESGLEAAAAALHNNYLIPSGRFYNGATLEGVRTKFCPVNPNWTNLVFGRMSQII